MPVPFIGCGRPEGATVPSSCVTVSTAKVPGGGGGGAAGGGALGTSPIPITDSYDCFCGFGGFSRLDTLGEGERIGSAGCVCGDGCPQLA